MGLAVKGKKVIAKIALELIKSNFLLDRFMRWGEREILKALVIKNERNRPIGAQEEKYYVVRNLIRAFEKKLKENTLAPSVKKWVFDTLVGDVILNWAERHPEAARRRKLEEAIPTFITLAPLRNVISPA